MILSLPIKFYPLGKLNYINFFYKILKIKLFLKGLLINEAIFIGVNTELTLMNQNIGYIQLQKSVYLK